MLELLFLLSFTLHNIEEALWLPGWSRHAEKFHPKVGKKEFHFALLIITTFGYFLTFIFMVNGGSNNVIKYAYFGFVLMMSLNSIFPHLIATILLKKYAPGTITGLLLNFPIGIYIVFVQYSESFTNYKLLLGFSIVTVATVIALKPLFKLGKIVITD